MQLIHCGVTYECDVAVKCTDDNYIKLYDSNGVEIAAFYKITDYSDYELSGGDFIAPCDCSFPIVLTTYIIGGRTITTNDWALSDAGEYYFEIENDLISGNATTCNVLLLFAPGTELEYTSTQESGKLTLSIGASAPLADVVIDSIQISRV